MNNLNNVTDAPAGAPALPENLPQALNGDQENVAGTAGAVHDLFDGILGKPPETTDSSLTSKDTNLIDPSIFNSLTSNQTGEEGEDLFPDVTQLLVTPIADEGLSPKKPLDLPSDLGKISPPAEKKEKKVKQKPDKSSQSIEDPLLNPKESKTKVTKSEPETPKPEKTETPTTTTSDVTIPSDPKPDLALAITDPSPSDLTPAASGLPSSPPSDASATSLVDPGKAPSAPPKKPEEKKLEVPHKKPEDAPPEKPEETEEEKKLREANEKKASEASSAFTKSAIAVSLFATAFFAAVTAVTAAITAAWLIFAVTFVAAAGLGVGGGILIKQVFTKPTTP